MADLFRKVTNQEQILKDRDHQLYNFIKECFITKAKEGKSSKELKDAVSSVDTALKKKYERRKDILRCGFFTPVSKPYRSLGTVFLDHQDLFASYISSEEQQQLKKILEKRVEEKLIHKIFQGKAEQVKKNQIPSTEQSQLQNGFYHIQKYLEENKWIRDVMHTGKPLSFCLKELDAKYPDSKKYLENETLPLIAKRPKSAHRYSQEKILDESVSFSSLKEKAVKRSKECGPLLQSIPKALDDEDQKKDIYSRRRKHVIEKLRTIYILLCGVVNMKCKDLKRFVPLPHSYVQFLLQEPQEGENPFPLGLSQLRRIHQQKETKCYQFMTIEAKKSRTPDLLWKTFVHNENTANDSESCRRPSKARSSAKESLKSELNETEISLFELPPWLALIETKNITEQRFRQKLKGSMDKVEMLKATFTNLQKNMAKVTHKRLLLKRGNRSVRMSAILQLLDISPEAHFETMITSIDHDTKVLEPPKHPPHWFTLLKNECLEIGPQEEINRLLQKLAVFHHFTASSIPSAEEKLCLLAISLPADQFLRLPVQDALLFIVGSIFKCSSKHVKQWFQYRKLHFSLMCKNQ